MQVLTIEVEKDEDFFTAQCKEHSNCFTQGKTIEETMHNITDVIENKQADKTQQVGVSLEDEVIAAL